TARLLRPSWSCDPADRVSLLFARRRRWYRSPTFALRSFFFVIPLSAMAGAPTFPPSETAWRVAGIKARVSQEGRGKGVRPRGVRAHPSLKNAKDGAPSSSWDERRDLSENTEKRNPGAQSGATVPQRAEKAKSAEGRRLFKGDFGRGDAGFGGPGDEQGYEGSDGVGVVGEDADGAAEKAALFCAQGGTEAVATVAFVFKTFHDGDFRISNFAVGVHAAGEDLDGDILGGKRIEENARGDFDFVVEIDFAKIVGNVLHFQTRPRGFNTRAPGGQIPGVGSIVVLQAKMAAVHGEIVSIDILNDHAVHVEFGAEANDGRFHAVEPLARQTVGAAFVEGGNDLAFEEFVESSGFDLILIAGILIRLAFADGPADFRAGVETNLPGFIPPTIKGADV